MNTVERKVILKADTEKVFKALTDADELMAWFPTVAKTDPRMGGEMRYEWAFEDSENDGFQDMQYTEFSAGQSFSHSWDAGGHPTIVHFKLSPKEEGTELDLRHDGWADGMDEAAEMHGQIWDGYMQNLKLYLEEGGDMRSQMKGQKTRK